jgi:NTP pyrophosphatase (non-canonical NTP hydrolase)
MEMDIEEMRKAAVGNAAQYVTDNGIEVGQLWATLKLAEEYGELAQAMLVAAGQCSTNKRVDEEAAKRRLGDEFADVLGMLLVNASMHKVDIEAAFRRKWMD